MLKALYHGYCATLLRLTVRLTSSLEDFFDHAFGLNALPAMGEAPRHDVITISSKAQQLQVLWLRYAVVIAPQFPWTLPLTLADNTLADNPLTLADNSLAGNSLDVCLLSALVARHILSDPSS